jgi:hypothetical protein
MTRKYRETRKDTGYVTIKNIVIDYTLIIHMYIIST